MLQIDLEKTWDWVHDRMLDDLYDPILNQLKFPNFSARNDERYYSIEEKLKEDLDALYPTKSKKRS